MNTIQPEAIERILIRGTNWVGDAVISVPALKAVRASFPRARISLMVRPWVSDVYAASDFVDEILPYDKQGEHKGLRGLLRIIARIRNERFDLAFLLQNAFEAAFIAWVAGIPRRVGYARDGRGFLLTHPCRIDPEVRSLHQAWYYLGILAGAGLLERQIWRRKDYNLSIALDVRASDVDGARALLRDRGVVQGKTVIGLNPGAFYGSAKRWLSDRYAAVADTLARRHDAETVIFGTAGERRIADEIAARMFSPPKILAGETTLGQLMGLIGECDLFITNDSGPMHLAAALGVPQVSVFGSTSEIATGPLSGLAQVVKNPVDCSPCFLRECPIDFRCMTGISVQQVVAVAEELLSRESARRSGKPSRPGAG